MKRPGYDIYPRSRKSGNGAGGGPLGYRLDFRDGAKAYLEYSVTNATAPGERLRLGVQFS